MTLSGAWLYPGTVVHERIRPVAHRFSYRVLALAADLDRFDAFARRTWALGHNGPGLMSLRDSDHGDGTTPLSIHARQLLADAGLSHAGHRVVLVCYPRTLGYVFNPVSVYFCSAADGALAATIYEVSNTYGERRSYVVPAESEHVGTHFGGCPKTFSVSPFTGGRGRYTFTATPPGDGVVIGIRLRDGDGPLLRTHFRGQRKALTSGAIVRHVAAMPLATLKVTAAIHWEALRLLVKGVAVQPRHRSPTFSVDLPDDADTRS